MGAAVGDVILKHLTLYFPSPHSCDEDEGGDLGGPRVGCLDILCLPVQLLWIVLCALCLSVAMLITVLHYLYSVVSTLGMLVCSPCIVAFGKSVGDEHEKASFQSFAKVFGRTYGFKRYHPELRSSRSEGFRKNEKEE